MTSHQCFWQADAPPQQFFKNKTLPSNADIVVIGGGFTGTSAALQLAKHGANVILLEAATIGWEASSRNGGQALSCLPHTLQQVIRQHGKALASEMFQTAVQSADTVAQIIQTEGIECDFNRNGSIEAASRPSHFEAFKREQDLLNEVADFEVQLVEGKDIQLELGTSAYHGLMVNPRSGSVQPAKFVQGLAVAAARAGAVLHEGVRVQAISKDGGTFTVRTNCGEIRCREVILAANAWNGNILPQFARRVLPVESFIIATEPLPAEISSKLIPKNRVVYDTRNILAYYRLSPDRRMVWGGEATLSGVNPQTNINILQDGMTRVFPVLKNIKIEYFWGGTIGLTMDETPRAGRIDGMWYSMCYVGHGVTLATYMGTQIANAILGKPSDNPFDLGAIPAIPLLKGSRWMGNLGKLWYQIMDKLG